MAKIRNRISQLFQRPPLSLEDTKPNAIPSPGPFPRSFVDGEASQFTYAPIATSDLELDLSQVRRSYGAYNMRIVRVDNPNDFLDLMYVPDSIKVKRDMKSSAIEIIGKNLPYYQFMSGERLVEFECYFSNLQAGNDAIKAAAWLESLAVMDDFKSGVPMVYLSFGELFKGLTFVIRPPIEIEYTMFEEASVLPRAIKAKLIFGETTVKEVTNKGVKRFYD